MLKISKSEYEEMRKHGEETYPNECCGILLGQMSDDVREVLQAVRCGNERSDSPQNRYSIAPLELIALQKRAREAGCEIIGFYHSHPDHAARWSATDFEEAHWLSCSYVITSVEAGFATRTQSYVLVGGIEEEKQFEDEELQVDEER